jgi:acyl-coenzyme A synthetase/AMP-(fatty) acid ligase
MLTPLPGVWLEKPGSATLPFFGVAPVILDPESGKELTGECSGVLCIKQVWSLKEVHDSEAGCTAWHVHIWRTVFSLHGHGFSQLNHTDAEFTLCPLTAVSG